MADSNKRKERSSDDRDNRGPKRSKGGSGGKWSTPHQLDKVASRGNRNIEIGDSGIWVTCAKNQERRATEELQGMLEECAERFYGIKPTGDGNEDGGESDEDIESAIKREVASLSTQKNALKQFSPVSTDLPCVVFFKVRPPIDPVDFVKKICNEIVSNPRIRRMRYINRLTPVTIIGKATEKGLEELGKTVLSPHFVLSDAEDKLEDGATAPSYAIRPTIRAHNTLKRLPVITQVAEMIGGNHKVNLSTPDNVIIIEIYQSICGMSVVGAEWEALKRFNLAELYQPAPKHVEKQAAVKAVPKPEVAKTDETRLVGDTQGTDSAVP